VLLRLVRDTTCTLSLIAVCAAATQASVPRGHPSCVSACSLPPGRKARSCVRDETRRKGVSQLEQGDGPVPRGRHEARVVTGCGGHHAAESPHIVGVPEDSTAQTPPSTHERTTAEDRRRAYTDAARTPARTSVHTVRICAWHCARQQPRVQRQALLKRSLREREGGIRFALGLELRLSSFHG